MRSERQHAKRNELMSENGATLFSTDRHNLSYNQGSQKNFDQQPSSMMRDLESSSPPFNQPLESAVQGQGHQQHAKIGSAIAKIKIKP